MPDILIPRVYPLVPNNIAKIMIAGVPCRPEPGPQFPHSSSINREPQVAIQFGCLIRCPQFNGGQSPVVWFSGGLIVH